MISIQDALNILRENLPQVRIETVALADAHGRYLAEPIIAPEPSPRYTNSAMDGYALRWADVGRASPESPVRLRVIGESRAGMPCDCEVDSATAVHISTGAMLPPGADTVVRVEDTRPAGDGTVEILAVRSPGQDIRHAGEEFHEGEELLRAGTRLSSRRLALLAAVGCRQVRVCGPPNVAILVTGSELASGDTAIKSYQIHDSNSIMLQTALRETGAIISSCVNVVDELDATIDSIREAVGLGVDFILCSGGVSVGEHDHVKEAAESAGFAKLFWRIRQKPGKPLYAAQKNGTYLFGLPGNPVSAFMCYAHYIRPLLFTMLGRGMFWNTITALAETDITNSGGRTNFIRVKLAKKPGTLPRIVDIKKQGSHMLSSIVNADGYIILEPGRTVGPDEPVNVYLF